MVKYIHIMGQEFRVTRYNIDSVNHSSYKEYKLYYGVAVICEVRMYKAAARKWFISFNTQGGPWKTITESRKAVYIKTRVLDHVLTNLSKIVNEDN